MAADNRVFAKELVDEIVARLNIADLENATIGEVLLVASALEEKTGIPFIRMDQGSPGLPPNRIGIEAEKAALDSGIVSQYPAAAGVAELKEQASRFVKAFLDLDITPRACIPTTGGVAASFASFIACTQRIRGKDKVLFIDPGFPIQKSQLKILGIGWVSFDIYRYRGEALRGKLEEMMGGGDIAAIVYSNPNNPAWICLEESELRIIGEMADRYDAVVMEDMAYFCMDFRQNLGRPFEPPYPPTVARYTDNYILMLSSSKIFSYAGQRMALACVSDRLSQKGLGGPAGHPLWRDHILRGAGPPLRRFGHLRADIHRLDPVHDHERLHHLNPIRLRRDAEGGMRGTHRLRRRHLRLRRTGRTDETHIPRQRFPHRL